MMRACKAIRAASAGMLGTMLASGCKPSVSAPVPATAAVFSPARVISRTDSFINPRNRGGAVTSIATTADSIVVRFVAFDSLAVYQRVRATFARPSLRLTNIEASEAHITTVLNYGASRITGRVLRFRKDIRPDTVDTAVVDLPAPPNVIDRRALVFVLTWLPPQDHAAFVMPVFDSDQLLLDTARIEVRRMRVDLLTSRRPAFRIAVTGGASTMPIVQYVDLRPPFHPLQHLIRKQVVWERGQHAVPGA